MIYSMTAFAREQAKTEFGDITLELRSVNQRFLECNFRLPDAFRSLEPEMRTRLNQYLQRGKIDVSLNFLPTVVASELKINEANLQQVVAAIAVIEKKLPKLASVDPLALLKWPGIAVMTELDNQALPKIILEKFELALKTLKQARVKEGTALATIILERVNAAEQELHKAERYAGDLAKTLRAKLQEKVQAFAVTVDSSRLEQEIVLQCQKADIDEELDRLKTHLQEVRQILGQGGVMGRKLDFLAQELNREANTLGSKSTIIELTNAAVELKVLIEQMREQIQNIE